MMMQMFGPRMGILAESVQVFGYRGMLIWFNLCIPASVCLVRIWQQTVLQCNYLSAALTSINPEALAIAGTS